jgi:hypothetical protein
MILTIELMGGLGNQLFQIFTAIAHAKKIKYDYVFPYSTMLTIGIPRRTYWENLLNSLIEYTTANRNYQITNEDMRTFTISREYGFIYTELPFFTKQHIKLFGYYQSYKYFQDEFQNIVELIRLKEKQQSVQFQYNSLLNKKKHLVSMHFRLGDYKEKENCHPIMPYEYYENALTQLIVKRILTKDDDDDDDDNVVELEMRVIYFCEAEDNENVLEKVNRLRENFPNIEFVKVDDGIEDWEQMLIMSCCHDNIIANSSFSWWGAYFNQNPDKKVFYPYLWFGTGLKHLTYDLFPSSWNKIFF